MSVTPWQVFCYSAAQEALVTQTRKKVIISPLTDYMNAFKIGDPIEIFNITNMKSITMGVIETILRTRFGDAVRMCYGDYAENAKAIINAAYEQQIADDTEVSVIFIGSSDVLLSKPQANDPAEHDSFIGAE
jgi:hypothetical protein